VQKAYVHTYTITKFQDLQTCCARHESSPNTHVEVPELPGSPNTQVEVPELVEVCYDDLTLHTSPPRTLPCTPSDDILHEARPFFWFVLLNDVGTSWPGGYVETRSTSFAPPGKAMGLEH
jgi:hypothetical protein